jgi:hypothetical protein
VPSTIIPAKTLNQMLFLRKCIIQFEGRDSVAQTLSSGFDFKLKRTQLDRKDGKGDSAITRSKQATSPCTRPVACNGRRFAFYVSHPRDGGNTLNGDIC